MKVVNKTQDIETRDEQKAPKLSVKDLRVRRFLALTEAIKEQTKELESLKAEFKHEGSFSTWHYIVTVEAVERKQAPSLKALVAKYGPSVSALCTTVKYHVVKAAKKGGEG